MKEKEVRNKIRKQMLEEQTLNLMIEKLGIEDIRSKQEELIRSLSELKSQLKKEE